MMYRIAEALLIRTYEEISAVVSLDENENVLGVQLFHTRFGAQWMHTEPGAKEIWLMSNHPQGRQTMSGSDLENAARLKECFPFLPLRMFITGEDIGCKEVAL